MNNYDNNMRGVLFKNKKKTTDKHPDFTGHGEVFGKQVWISVWEKKSVNGVKYKSLAFTEKEERKQDNNSGSNDDNMPF